MGMREPTEKTKERIMGAMRGDAKRAWTISSLSRTLGVDKKSAQATMDLLVEEKKVVSAVFGMKSRIFLWVDS